MRQKSIISVVIASVIVIFTSCKIQDAPGAYQPAKGRITVEELEKQNEKKPEVAPTPAPIVREVEEKVVAPKQETVKEPVFVPTPVVAPQPKPAPTTVPEVETTVTPAPVAAEKEVTRAEKFEVIEEQKDIVVLKKYHVVIGSFGNKDNALRLQEQMRPQYDPIIVRNDKGMYRVLLSTYDTYKEAKDKITVIKDQFPDAWVLIRE